MSLLKIVLALVCFGIGYLIADASGSRASPIYLVGLLVAVIGTAVIFNHFNKKNK